MAGSGSRRRLSAWSRSSPVSSSLGRFGPLRALELLTLLGIVLYGLLETGAFSLDLMGKFFLLAIFALSVDLVWGYAGLLSLGHAAFFGAGAYMAALVLVRHLFGLDSLLMALGLSIVVPVLMAGILGAFLFTGRGVHGAYFAVATLAVT